MKRAIILFAVFFALMILIVTPSFAQSNSSATDSSQMSASMAAKTDYSLAYPGILPDNPLYFLKAARDKLVSFLISDDQKKEEFNLLTSDKRVNASYILATKGEAALSVTTLSKSNNYLEDAVSNLMAARKEGKDMGADTVNLRNAILKHIEIVVGIKNKVGKNYNAQMTVEEKRLFDYLNSVSKLIKK
jgi:hypothetical protein